MISKFYILKIIVLGHMLQTAGCCCRSPPTSTRLDDVPAKVQPWKHTDLLVSMRLIPEKSLTDDKLHYLAFEYDDSLPLAIIVGQQVFAQRGLVDIANVAEIHGPAADRYSEHIWNQLRASAYVPASNRLGVQVLYHSAYNYAHTTFWDHGSSTVVEILYESFPPYTDDYVPFGKPRPAETLK